MAVGGRGGRCTISFAIIFRPLAIVLRYLDAEDAVLFTLRTYYFRFRRFDPIWRLAADRNAHGLELVNLCLHTVSYALA